MDIKSNEHLKFTVNTQWSRLKNHVAKSLSQVQYNTLILTLLIFITIIATIVRWYSRKTQTRLTIVPTRRVFFSDAFWSSTAHQCDLFTIKSIDCHITDKLTEINLRMDCFIDVSYTYRESVIKVERGVFFAPKSLFHILFFHPSFFFPSPFYFLPIIQAQEVDRQGLNSVPTLVSFPTSCKVPTEFSIIHALQKNTTLPWPGQQAGDWLEWLNFTISNLEVLMYEL